MPVGRTDEAIAEGKRALELEPMSLVTGAILSATYSHTRQYDAALEQARKTYELEPNFQLGHWTLGLAYIGKGTYTEAIELSEKSLKTDPPDRFMLEIAGVAYAKAGRKPEAEAVIGRYRKIAETGSVDWYQVAHVYAALGDKENAFMELEKAFNDRGYMLYRLKVDPLMDPLRGDPRFAAMLKRMNLPQ